MYYDYDVDFFLSLITHPVVSGAELPDADLLFHLAVAGGAVAGGDHDGREGQGDEGQGVHLG